MGNSNTSCCRCWGGRKKSDRESVTLSRNDAKSTTSRLGAPTEEEKTKVNEANKKGGIPATSPKDVARTQEEEKNSTVHGAESKINRKIRFSITDDARSSIHVHESEEGDLLTHRRLTSMGSFKLHGTLDPILAPEPATPRKSFPDAESERAARVVGSPIARKEVQELEVASHLHDRIQERGFDLK